MNEIKKDKNYSLYLSGLIDEDELMRRISLYEISSHPYEDKVVRKLDTKHPQYDPQTRGIRPKGFEGRGFSNNLPDPIEGLEGPFTFASGKTLYYDPKEGKYYDRGSDIYVDDTEMQYHLYPKR